MPGPLPQGGRRWGWGRLDPGEVQAKEKAHGSQGREGEAEGSACTEAQRQESSWSPPGPQKAWGGGWGEGAAEASGQAHGQDIPVASSDMLLGQVC